MLTEKQLKEKIVFHVGMPRTGSTFLYSVFAHHPEVYLPPVKELNYFNMHKEKPLSWYFDFFKGMKKEKVAFDFFPSAFTGLEAIENILSFNPKAKVILGVRKPSDFSVSCYKHFKLISPEDHLRYEEFLKRGIKVYNPGHVSRMEMPVSNEEIIQRISHCLKRVKKNLLVYSYESIEKDPLKLLKSLESFLELKPYFNEENFRNRKVNSSDREVSKFFLMIRSNPFLYKMVLKLFPHKFLSAFTVFISDLAVRKVSKKKADATKKISPDTALAREVYKEADIFYQALFDKKELLQYGDGTPFKA